MVNQEVTSTLRPYREESVNFDTTENLYIEGDNLEVLKLLQETYLGKIKMIYIDPPYNTSHDFIYKDDFSQSADEYSSNSGQYDNQGNRLVANTESNGRFHTDWLNMVYPRLKLARDLLTEDGVIFISIDDNECFNLKKVCDEIFGEENCIGPIIQNKQNAKNDTINVQKNHEYILVYRKEKIFNGSQVEASLTNKKTIVRKVLKDGDRYYYLNDSITTRGEGGTLNARPNLGYTIYYNAKTLDIRALQDYNVSMAKNCNDESLLYEDDKDLIGAGYIAIRPPKVRGKLGAWTWSLDKFNSNIDNICITNTKENYSVRSRTFVDAKQVRIVENELIYEQQTKSNSKSIIEFSTNDGTNVLNSLFKEKSIFNNPKNIDMLVYLLSLFDDTSFVVLDFFSGSAATAHAVMKLNAEDGGQRKFIMVQLPEKCDEKSEAYKAGYKNICEIGKERIRRAGKQILDELKEKNGELFADDVSLDIGFRDLKLDSSNMEDVYYTPEETEQRSLDNLLSNIKEGRTAEDLLFQAMLDLGVLLSAKIKEEEIAGKKVFNVDNNYLITCFDEDINEDVIIEVAKKKPIYFVMRDSSLANDSVFVNFDQIFARYSPDTIRKVL